MSKGLVGSIFARLLARGPIPEPPGELSYAVGGSFEVVGKEFRQHFVDLCSLRPDESVLDVGCGCGRIAVPLTQYLCSEARYEGFDIMPRAIRWCRSHITRRYPNFRFLLADLHNKTYNPKGKQRADEYRFPFDDDSFDFVFLTSVFTHMLPKDMQHYLREIVRVMREGGRCLVTFFLLNEESVRLIEAGKSVFDFKHDMGGCFAVNPEDPEAALAYEESRIRGLMGRTGLKIQEPVRYGSWCGRTGYLSGQDIIVATLDG